MAKIDLTATSGEAMVPEYFEHPTAGYLSYDPGTLYISPNRDGQKPIGKPISMPGKFFGTKQPYVPTCSEPSEGNRGCEKWAACPMKQWRHIGPGTVIIKKHGHVGAANCYDYWEVMRGGRPSTQMHLGLEGWVLDTTRTTIDVLGRGWAIVEGVINKQSSPEEIRNVRPRKEQMEMGGLLAPWWPLLKKKGLPLPEAAERYPELVEDDEDEAQDSGRGSGDGDRPVSAGRKVRKGARASKKA